jgi:hypothetical protein
LVEWEASCRLIPSRFPPIELYDPIAPESDWDALKRIENMTNPRLREQAGVLEMLLPEDRGVEQNWLVAPFAYPNPEPSRFSDGSYGVCVVAETLDTALLLSVRSREEFLRRTAERPSRFDMRLLKTPVSARLHDLTTLQDVTSPDLPKTIKQLRADKSYGAVLRGPRGGKDRIAVILRPTAFGPAIQAEHFCFNWNGERIHQIYNYNSGKTIDPRSLAPSSAQDAA